MYAPASLLFTVVDCVLALLYIAGADFLVNTDSQPVASTAAIQHCVYPRVAMKQQVALAYSGHEDNP